VACRRTAATAPPAQANADSDSDEVRPVYTDDAGPPEPSAEALCRALHALPEQRRAACCNQKMRIDLSGECVRMLSAALRAKAVTLDKTAVKNCENALSDSLAACDWVGPWPVVLPAACEGLVAGTRPVGARCRSSLECRDGLRCLGVGPTDVGTCGPPRAIGASCGTAVDPLAAFTLDTEIDRTHPECGGYCDRRHCVGALATGASCVSSASCGSRGRCAGGHCVASEAGAAGAPCTDGGCGRGLRCVRGRCVAPLASGQKCTQPFECRGGCKNGSCGMDCSRR
jgi:hypothetical protein